MNQQYLNIPIVFEDDRIVVFDKPSGVVVNRSQTWSETTLADFAQERLNSEDIEDNDTDFYSRGGIVHRLDKDTSGIVLGAKDEATFEYLKSLFKMRKVKKTYRAICVGEMRYEELSVNAPIGRNPKSRLKLACVEGGKEARTDFELLKIFELDNIKYSSVLAKPLTGRTHQIRVHLASLNLPIAGDSIYLGRRMFYSTQPHFSRLMLHAHELAFYDEVSKKDMTFTSALPQEFIDIE
jgi:23S rRNA pseudouridine1911/1915/1917 synthase